MARNAVGREIPESLPGLDRLRPFAGAFAQPPEGSRRGAPLARPPLGKKRTKSLEEALDALELRDGMWISFHHHLRNGDRVVQLVLDALASRGLKDLTLVPTALFPVHAGIIPHIESGLIGGIHGSVNGPVGRRVSGGCFDRPVVLRSHGGRARAVRSGDIRIDVAFVAAPCADEQGNANGSEGPSACGPLGYILPDVEHADRVVVITDHLVPYPASPISIPETQVDLVVPVDSIGDPAGIVSGTTRVTTDPTRLLMAHHAARVIESTGLIQDGLVFQTGAGGASLAAAAFVRQRMQELGVVGDLGIGGITSFFVEMLEEGLFRRLMDVQSFDLEAVRSLGRNPDHLEISATQYADIHAKGCAVNRLDAVILGATEIDMDFNVNVNTEADGALLHGIGGHQDTAAGAGLTIIIAPLLRGRIPLVTEQVLTVSTPGETVDVLVTDRGIAVHPKRTDLADRFRDSRLPLKSMEELLDLCHRFCGRPEPVRLSDRIVAVIEYRDGTVLDVVRGLPQVG